MRDRDWLARRFEDLRPRLRAVAVRMLGPGGDADDAVQEAWLRLSRSDAGAVHDLGRWLTTVVGRVCLDMLRSRRARREGPISGDTDYVTMDSDPDGDPTEQALLQDSIGVALLVVLDTLEPAERLAFVLHDVFAVPYADIAGTLDRSPAATKMLASRARQRLRVAGAAGATGTVTTVDTGRQRAVVSAFLAASRRGDLRALVALLDRDAVLRTDDAARRAGAPDDVRGGEAVAAQFSGRARGVRLALVDGVPGGVWLHRGTPAGVFRFAVTDGRVTAIDLICDAERVAAMDLVTLAGAAGRMRHSDGANQDGANQGGAKVSAPQQINPSQ